MIPKFSRLKLHPFITAQILKARYQRAADLDGSNSGFLMMSQARHPLRQQHPGWRGYSQALSQSCWQEVLVPPHVGLSKEQLTAGQWAPTEQESRERDRQKPVLYNLISEVTSDIIISAIFYTWYLVTWGDYTKVWIPGLLETSQRCTNLARAGSTRAAEEHLSHQLQN